MLKIRLQRVGKKNAPSFRVVLTEHKSPPQGKFQEILGFYNPRNKERKFKEDRIKYWISKGAQPSPTVYNLLIDGGILKGIKLKAWRPKQAKATSSETPSEVGIEEGKKEEIETEIKEEKKEEKKEIKSEEITKKEEKNSEQSSENNKQKES